MHAAISPYHLTSREPAALAALLLAERVLTVLPTGPGSVTKASVRAWLRDAPRYVRLLESWRWSGALWRAGVIRSTLDGLDAADLADDARAAIAREDAWSPLRAFEHRDLHEPEDRLDAWCADLLKGGPDPGWCVPVVAGLDRFARAHGLVGVRSGGRGARAVTPPSLTQRAESLLGRACFSVGVPVLLAAGGEVILRAREVLEPELVPLREAMAQALGSDPGPEAREGQARVRTAAARLGAAFDAVKREWVDRDDEQGVRVEAGLVRIEARRLPADAALRASVAALRAAEAARARAARGGAPSIELPPPAEPAALPVLTITPMDVRIASA